MPASFYLFAGCIPVSFPRFRVGKKSKSKKARKIDNDNPKEDAPKLTGKPSLAGLSCSGTMTDSTESLTSTTSSYTGSLTFFPTSPVSQHQTASRNMCFSNSIMDSYSDDDESISNDDSIDENIGIEISEAAIELMPAEPYYFMNIDNEILELQLSTSNNDDWGYFVDFA